MDPDERYRRWAEHFNRHLDDPAWDDDPWAELAVALFLLAHPDPWPGSNHEWGEFFMRALDRCEDAAGQEIPVEIRALLRMIHPLRGVRADDGSIVARA